MVQGLFLSFRLSSTRINKGFYPLLRKITINRRAPFTSRAWIIFIAPTEIILFALRYLLSQGKILQPSDIVKKALYHEDTRPFLSFK